MPLWMPAHAWDERAPHDNLLTLTLDELLPYSFGPASLARRHPS